jgi:hypothetical protein
VTVDLVVCPALICCDLQQIQIFSKLKKGDLFIRGQNVLLRMDGFEANCCDSSRRKRSTTFFTMVSGGVPRCISLTLIGGESRDLAGGLPEKLDGVL